MFIPLCPNSSSQCQPVFMQRAAQTLHKNSPLCIRVSAYIIQTFLMYIDILHLAVHVSLADFSAHAVLPFVGFNGIMIFDSSHWEFHNVLDLKCKVNPVQLHTACCISFFSFTSLEYLCILHCYCICSFCT